MSSTSTVASLLAAHRTELVAFAEKRLGSRAAADDVVQQAAIRALDRADQLRETEAGRAWLFQITRRLLVDQLRARTNVTLDERELVEALAEEAEFGCACVLANLERLPDAHASVLRRALIDGASAAEIAAELGLSINAATVRLSRARAALRDQLRTHCGTESIRECLDCACNSRGCCEPESASRAHLENE